LTNPTDNGHIKRTHYPEGDWLHGVGLAVTTKGSKVGITAGLTDYVHKYAINQRKKGCFFFTRIPGYYRYQHEMCPEDYVVYKRNGKVVDQELRVLETYGARVVTPPVIKTDYVEGGGDAMSCRLSVLVAVFYNHQSYACCETSDLWQPNSSTVG
jgi:hypothetical protein